MTPGRAHLLGAYRLAIYQGARVPSTAKNRRPSGAVGAKLSSVPCVQAESHCQKATFGLKWLSRRN